MSAEHHEFILTVFTIAYARADDCRLALEELGKQTIADQLEVILVAPNRDGIDEAMFEPFAAHQWVMLPEIRNCGQPMAAATHAARGEFITYVEEHSYLNDDCAEKLLAAHRKGYDAVVFVMDNANPQTWVSWAHYYGQFGPVAALRRYDPSTETVRRADRPRASA